MQDMQSQRKAVKSKKGGARGKNKRIDGNR